MTTTVNPTFISYRSPKNPFSIGDKPSISPSTRTRIVTRPSSSPIFQSLIAKCTNRSEQGGGSGAGGLREALSGMVEEGVAELLNREENRVLLDGLEKATQRVDMAQKELAEIKKKEIEAKEMRVHMNQLESRASEIAECQREILVARAMVEEAQRSLIVGETKSGDSIMEVGSEEFDRNKERWESVKAASVSAFVGSLAGLPISLTQLTGNSELILPLATTFISCALFGVTFRYAVRRDLDNIQLKTGISAAFAFVKGLGTLDGGPPLELEIRSFLSRTLSGAVYVSQSLFVFLFAAVALDFCYKMRLLSPFPIKQTASETNRM
ncbi:Processed sterol regulatory element-binding protein [Actinidia chinensis var. chinensis]|uniref:Processed sterol regulatory element-binding protein n=1 Tax=Actinidia chinensis var. chinensis TaxID=1590841 RepID=A0A2R6Q8P6_ACTCC|nr:Processed sterol regulatory element-binding protein [Actinidia chinensis var. chinensis]